MFGEVLVLIVWFALPIINDHHSENILHLIGNLNLYFLLNEQYETLRIIKSLEHSLPRFPSKGSPLGVGALVGWL
jgi:hypothetical protein